MYKKQKQFTDAYIVTVDMGYGHQRAVHPLRDIAACPPGCICGGAHIITANKYAGIPGGDTERWESGRFIYETISRMKNLPFVGEFIFGGMDHFQKIESFYPRRDLSAPSIQLRQIYSMIHRGWGRHLIQTLNKAPRPFVTSFFTTAFFADEHGYKGPMYCLCTDTDISRAWAPLDPKKSKIIYLAPNKRVKERLMLYGVRQSHIRVTGFPLPQENIGGDDLIRLKESLGCRLANLDPTGKYHGKYEHTIAHYLGVRYCRIDAGHPLTITFAVGGAGAQRDIGVTILKSLHRFIDKGEIRLNLVAGIRNDVYCYYRDAVRALHLEKHHGGTINIIYAEDKLKYFEEFNKTLLQTDILWTKPSELSFYAGLGLPIIMAPSIGAQEESNRAWLHAIGAGFEQEDPRYTHEWLFDWLHSGWLAQAAMEGFMNAPRRGAQHIKKVVLEGKRSEIEDVHLL